MTLFLKHLLMSIRKRPLQPVILVLTLVLSMLSSVVSFGLQRSLILEGECEQAQRYGRADMTVTLNGESRSRFMFAAEAEELLGGRAEVAGAYELLMLTEGDGEMLLGVAVDFHEVEDVFPLSFIEHGDIYESELADTALISYDLASRRGLSLGDTLTVDTFGAKKTYVVGAISDKQFMASYDVMVDVGGVMRLVASDSLIAAALGDSFKPSGTLYIDVKDGYTLSECEELLKTRESFREKTFTDVQDAVVRERNSSNLNLIIDVAILLSAALSAAVTFCCLYILAAERSGENDVFIAAGARPWQMNAIQYVEVAIYWLVGALLGTAAAYPLFGVILDAVGFEYAPRALGSAETLKGAGLLLLSSLLTVTVFVVGSSSRRRGKATHASVRYAIGSSIATACLVLLLFTAPPTWRMVVGVLTMFMLLLMLFTVTPPVMKWVLSLVDKGLQKRGRADFSLSYAIKNLYSVKVLHNFSRLSALLVAIVMSTAFIIGCAEGNIKASKRFIDGEFAILNATDRCKSELLSCESAESIEGVMLDTFTFDNDFTFSALSLTDKSTLSDNVTVDRLPTGNEAVVTRDLATAFSLEVGDTFSVELGAERLELVIIEITPGPVAFVLFDCESFGMRHNLLIASAKEGVDSDVLLSELTERTALELAAVVSTEELFDSKIRSMSVYLNVGYLLLGVTVIFSLTGIIDNLYQCYEARREEFCLYSYAGMSKKSIGRMKRREVLISLAFGLVLGCAASLLMDLAIDMATSQYGYDATANFFALFRQ